MTSEVSICNLAMSWLGTNPITSLDDDTVEAKQCKANYEPARDATLEDRNWTFAIERVILTPEVEVPAFGYSHQFLIPANIKRIVSVSNGAGTGSNTMGTEVDWQKEKNKIVANLAKVYVRAVVQEKDPSRYPPTFVHALAARLAAEMAIPLTHSTSLLESMWTLYGTKIRIASGTDGRQGRREQTEAIRLVGVRQQGGIVGGFV